MNNIIDKVLTSNNIVLLCHNNPDGDAIGSTLAMYHTLKKLDKEVDIVIKEPPKRFNFLEGFKDIKEESSKNYDTAIILDTANIDRVNDPSDILNRVKRKYVIDHHISNTKYGDENLVEERPACCQIVYEIIKEINIEITKELGESLMTGLLTDTGGFSHQDVLPSTFAMAEDLSKIVNISLLYDKALRTITINQFNIKKIALDNLEFYYNGKVAISYITEEDMINTGVDQNDCGILVNIPLEIEGIEVSIILRKYKEEIRVSIRSKQINLNDLVKAFGGGGHINAAGVTVKMPYEEIKKQVLEEVGKKINEWSISSK